MADNKNLCEEIQIAILSDEKMTEKQLEHIENCEECKALLSQILAMKKDMGALSVPGLEDGKITEAVMEQIKKTKNSLPFPKFKVTHHLGTVAAVVIILTAALIIKNPSIMNDENTLSAESVSEDTTDTSAKELPEHWLGVVVTAEEESDGSQNSVMRATPADGTEQSEKSVQDDSTNDVYLYSADTEAVSENTVFDYYADIPEAESDDTADTETAEITNGAAGTLTADESAAAVPEEGEKQKFTSHKYSAGGGGGSGSAYVESASDVNSACDYSTESENTENWKLMLPALPDGMVTAFDGIEFLNGEENFDYNIQLANARLYELYGKEHVLTRELLSECGCTGNAEFLIFINDGIGYDSK